MLHTPTGQNGSIRRNTEVQTDTRQFGAGTRDAGLSRPAVRQAPARTVLARCPAADSWRCWPPLRSAML